jgi:hypothetical protein
MKKQGLAIFVRAQLTCEISHGHGYGETEDGKEGCREYRRDGENLREHSGQRLVGRSPWLTGLPKIQAGIQAGALGRAGRDGMTFRGLSTAGLLDSMLLPQSGSESLRAFRRAASYDCTKDSNQPKKYQRPKRDLSIAEVFDKNSDCCKQYGQRVVQRKSIHAISFWKCIVSVLRTIKPIGKPARKPTHKMREQMELFA